MVPGDVLLVFSSVLDLESVVGVTLLVDVGNSQAETHVLESFVRV